MVTPLKMASIAALIWSTVGGDATLVKVFAGIFGIVIINGRYSLSSVVRSISLGDVIVYHGSV
jgi:hypothetical protein